MSNFPFIVFSERNADDFPRTVQILVREVGLIIVVRVAVKSGKGQGRLRVQVVIQAQLCICGGPTTNMFPFTFETADDLIVFNELLQDIASTRGSADIWRRDS